MLRYLKRIVLMLQFLTTIPIKANLDVTEDDYGKGLVFAPFAGLVIGSFLAGLWYAVSFVFPPLVCAIIVIAGYIVITGGIHLDGLGDTFDGLFSNRSKERILEIMRDSRVGTNAVLAVFIVLIMNFSLISSLDSLNALPALFLMPVAGRVGSLIGAGISNYARSGDGLGKSFIDYCGIREILLGLPLYFAIFFIVAGVTGLFLALVPITAALAVTRFFTAKISGATGDILGAVCEINQTVFLFACFIVFNVLLPL